MKEPITGYVVVMWTWFVALGCWAPLLWNVWQFNAALATWALSMILLFAIPAWWWAVWNLRRIWRAVE